MSSTHLKLFAPDTAAGLCLCGDPVATDRAACLACLGDERARVAAWRASRPTAVPPVPRVDRRSVYARREATR